MIRAAIYLRVSTDRQAKEGDSIPAQRDALLKYISDHDDMILAGTYIDDGVSGTRSDRDELNRLLDDVKAGKVDLILITKLDRLYRSIRHYLNMMDVLDKYNVGWQAIWENYETVTPQGRLIVNATMSFAQFEAEQTGQRIKQVFDYKKAHGEVVTGNVTPGYHIRDKHLVIDDPVADQVRDLFRHYAQVGKLYEAVRYSGPDLPKTKQGIKQLLQRRIYTGEAYGNPNFCEPIIDRDLFDRVQLQLSRNIKNSQKRIYLFSGLVRCAECGCVMASISQYKYGHRYNMYRCPKHFQCGNSRCGNMKVLSENKMEKYLLDNLADLISNAVMQAEVAAAPAKYIAKQRNVIEKKLDRLTDLYVDGQLDKQDYLRRKEALLADLDALVMPAEAQKSPVLGFDAVKGINLYTKLNAGEKRLFWRSIIKEIRFDRSRNATVYFL